MASTPHDDADVTGAGSASFTRWRADGVLGNELLTSTVAVVLIILLAGEGLTLLDLRGLVDEHMLIGLALIPPLLLKLGSVGYRFVRYYGGASTYTAKGPPQPLLRVIAPVLIAATITLLASGVVMLAAGDSTRSVLRIHQLSAIVWVAVFAVHVLAYIPRVARSLVAAARATGSNVVRGGRLRGLAVAGAVCAGAVLAVALFPVIQDWHRTSGGQRRPARAAPVRGSQANGFGVVAVTNAFAPLLRRSPHPRVPNLSGPAAADR